MSSKPLTLTDNNQTEEDKQLQNRVKSSGPIPEHIAIIMDGNGRWAQKKGNIRLFGHRAGVESVRDITESCAQLGVGYLTLYAFSTENWSRPSSEINGLMKLLVQTLRNEAERLNKKDIPENLESLLLNISPQIMYASVLEYIKTQPIEKQIELIRVIKSKQTRKVYLL